METLEFRINKSIYSATPVEDDDQVLYEIRLYNKPVCVIGLNEHAKWEANNAFNPAMVEQLGELIELNDE